MSVELIKALQNPALYDHPTSDFCILETHISWVILTGPYAYKIKKPINFGFLDFSTLESRQYFCHEELRLNRRFAPDLYLDVIPIFGSPCQPKLTLTHTNACESSAHPIDNEPPFEYAVKMVQFDQSGLLDALEESQKLTLTHITTLAQQLAHVHQHADHCPPDAEFGSASSVINPVKDNFSQIENCLHTTSQITALQPLKEWANDRFETLKPLIKQRKAKGFIRECHGDLHLGNITLFNQNIVIFDCIEFNASLRWIDTISDLAFLVMDLEKRGRTHYANQLTNRYIELTGDYQGAALLRFYKAYRAMVRAKIAMLSIDGNTHATDAPSLNPFLEQYRQYTALAAHYQSRPHRFILLMHGYSGSGKSYISSQLVEQLGALRVRTDVERKRLFHYAENESSQSPIDAGIYTHEATKKTYQKVASIASTLLSGEHAVIIDAAHLKRWQRLTLKEVADKLAVPLMIITCQADKMTLKDRIIKRSEIDTEHPDKDASEAGIETLEAQYQTAESLTSDELDYTIKVNTEQDDHLTLAVQSINQYIHETTNLQD